MSFIDVTDADFGRVVLGSRRPVLVDYWADWCTPCKQLAPILDELAESFGDRMRFVKLDTNRNHVTPTTYAVHGLPTIHIFVDGELVRSFQGSKPKAVLTEAIEALVKLPSFPAAGEGWSRRLGCLYEHSEWFDPLVPRR